MKHIVYVKYREGNVIFPSSGCCSKCGIVSAFRRVCACVIAD